MLLDTLPSEILRVITDKLSFKDKLNLCKTCHALHQQVSKTNLYEVLAVRENTEDVIRMFQDNILYGPQVQILDIDMDELSDELYSHLADIFPNVARVKTTRVYRGRFVKERKEREDIIMKPALKWRESLIKYSSDEDWMYFRGELFSSPFPRLKDLHLYSAFNFPGRKVGFDPLFLSKGITNAPMLTRLHLDMCDISVDSLEEIHKGCPYIRSLELVGVMLIVDDHALPSSIEPANSVLQLRVIAASFDKHGLYLDYIIHKYPNLRGLGIYILNEDEFEIEEYLRAYHPNFKRTVSDGIGEQNQICRKHMSELKQTLKAYEDGVPAFLSRLPTSIKVLSLQYGLFDNAIEILSKKKSAISDLKLHSLPHSDGQSSIKSDQLQYIKTLISLDVLTINIKSSVQRCGLEFVSNTITVLSMKVINSGFYINWLIAMFPSLELLSIESKEYLLVEEDNKDTAGDERTYPKLRKLNLINSKLHPESLKYLKRALPNVEELRWKAHVNTVQGQSATYSADFTGWNLEKLFLRTASRTDIWTSNYTITSTPDRTRRFLQKQYHKKPILMEDEPEFVEGTDRFNIACDDIKYFFLNNKRIGL